MTTDEMLERYYEEFGEYPTIILCIPFEDEHYRKLILQSIDRGTKITEEELDQMAEAEPYDIA